jgi:hypothetical protein
MSVAYRPTVGLFCCRLLVALRNCAMCCQCNGTDYCIVSLNLLRVFLMMCGVVLVFARKYGGVLLDTSQQTVCKLACVIVVNQV